MDLTSNGADDIFVLKLDASGNFLWAKAIGGTFTELGNSITTDASGNVYLTGSFQGTVDFDPGINTMDLTSNGADDIFVLKLDASGDFLWAKAIGGDGGDGGNSLTTDASGNVYVTGWFQNTVDFDPGAGVVEITVPGLADMFVLKLDASGEFVWAISNQFTSAGEGDHPNGWGLGYAITADDSGNILLTGKFSGTVDFDPGEGTVNLSSPDSNISGIFVQKLDASGNLIWVKSMEGTIVTGSTQMSRGNSIGTDASGNVYLTGAFRGNVDFDPGAGEMILTPIGSTYADIFVQKLNSSGELLWVKAMRGTGNKSGKSISIDSYGNVYLTGYFWGDVDFDPADATTELLSSNPMNKLDIFVQKLDASGNLLWVYAMGGTDHDFGNSIIANVLGEVYVTGSFKFTADFDPDATGELNMTTANNSTDFFVQKISQPACTAPAPNLTSLGDLNDQCSVSLPTAPIATNSCGTLNGTPNVSFPITTSGTTLVTWTFDAGGGNKVTQTQNVTINDVTAPAIGADLAELPGECSVAMPVAPTATDNCSGTIITGTPDVSFPITFQGTTVVTWTYEDGNGNKSTQTQNVIIDDVTAPEADEVTGLADLSGECSVAMPTAPTATDNCSNSITGTTDTTVFPITAQGITTISWTYDDGNGNKSTQTQNVVIDDVTAPEADEVTGLADLSGECSVAMPAAPTATDNCSGTVTGTPNVTFPVTAQDTTVVTWTYDDGNGNKSTQAQNVIITDVTAPATGAALADLSGECSVAMPTAPTATDNCSGSISGTPDVAFPITGTTTVTWTFEDGNGNTSTQTQNVVITDVAAPEADAAELADLTSECLVAMPTAPTATDNCSVIITGTTNTIFPITDQGTRVVTWTYDDGNGNTTTQTQNVIITPIDNTVAQNNITLTANADGHTYQWVDCNNGNAPISGETSQSFTADSDGSYAVEINNGSCTVTSDCIEMTVMGISDDLNELGITVYPNPITDRLNIDIGENRKIQIEIFDNSGKMIISKSTKRKITTIDLSGYTPGTYFIHLTNDEFRTAKISRTIIKK